MWTLLADAVVIVHLLFILFAIFGGLLTLRWPRTAYLHLPVLTWALWISFSNSVCPLTPLENGLRQRGGEAAYAEGFINHYIMPIIYPPGLTITQQIVLGSLLLAGNLVLYALLIKRRQERN